MSRADVNPADTERAVRIDLAAAAARATATAPWP